MKKYRRGAILVLVLVLLLNSTVTATGSTDNPNTIVDSYGALFSAISEAQDGDVIGISGVVTIPAIVNLNRDNKNITLVRMSESSQIVISGVYGDEAKATLSKITFDGRGGNTGEDNPIGGAVPFVVVESNALFEMCDFQNIIHTLGDGGAVSVTASGNATFNSCIFNDNTAQNGASIYNEGTVKVDNSTFKDSWAEDNGGAIYNKNMLTINNTEIKGNTARIGGGVYNIGSTEIYNSLIWNNTASSQGSDLANDASLSNFTTEEEFNSWLQYYNLYFNGWYNELDPLVGGAGEYRKFLTTDTDPSTVTPTPDPTEEPSTEPSTQPSTEDPSTPSTEPTTEPTGGGEATDPTDTPEPSTEPSTGATEEPSKGDNTEEDKKDPEPTTKPEESGSDKPATPSNIDNSSSTTTTDNSDHSTTDNSQSSTSTDNSTSTTTTDNSTTDNSQSSTDNSSSMDNHSTSSSNTSTTDNHSSSVSNVDNSSSRSESSKTENSNNTTSNTYNYYATDKSGETPVQPVGASTQPITVNVTVPEAKTVETASQEPTVATTETEIPQNIHIQAEGVNVNYDYTEDGVTINITPYKAPESPTEEPKAVQAKSWVDYVTVILLAVLVLLELKDKIKLKDRS